MNRHEVEVALAEIGRAPDEGFPLFEAAILCALHEEPRARPRPGPPDDRGGRRPSQTPAAARIAGGGPGRIHGRRLHLAGDVMTYDDPANADMLSVCERRKGLPVALGVIYLQAARRCELKVAGVDFPGHFLLRIETHEGPLALDPFSEGRVVLPSELIRRALRTGLTPDVADRLEVLMAPVADRAVVLRLENNIYARASRTGDHARAERSALRRALLDPAGPPPLDRRGGRPRRPGRPRGSPGGPGPRPDPRRRRRHRRQSRPRAGAAEAELGLRPFRRARGSRRRACCRRDRALRRRNSRDDIRA